MATWQLFQFSTVHLMWSSCLQIVPRASLTPQLWTRALFLVFLFTQAHVAAAVLGIRQTPI